MAIDQRILDLLAQMKEVSKDTDNIFVFAVADCNGKMFMSCSPRGDWLVCDSLARTLSRFSQAQIDVSFITPTSPDGVQDMPNGPTDFPPLHTP